METKTISIEQQNMPFTLDELVTFLLHARGHGWQTNTPRVTNPQRPGFKEFVPYREGDFEYIDSYAGKFYAPGQEIIRHKGIPAWNMSYNGGMLPEFHGDPDVAKEVFAHLKHALSQVTFERPFRGPPALTNDNFTYYSEFKGDITNFKGIEWIVERKKWIGAVFHQDIMGGLIIY